MKKKKNEVTDYDSHDTSGWIDVSKPKKLSDLGFALPKEKMSQVVSLRLPTKLLNAIRSIGVKKDIPYQSLIKLFLWDRVKREI